MSALGSRQAAALTGRLRTLPITRIVSSDLRRARDTVSELADELGLPVEADRRWREIANGEWSGLLPDDIEGRWPDLWARYIGGEDVARPGGERWGDVRRRAIEAFQDLAGQLQDHDLAVVSTHGGPGLAVTGWAAGITLDGSVFRGPFGPLGNASITTIAIPGPRLLGVNDVGHLEAQELGWTEVPSWADRG